ncbi:hypothetical protein [Almyronema epifaneia]|uniref:Uncharacterized protein n=1 Tax=Almyronema epifaneia S1 TaxID=2991925 RepID=A0ABW6IK13_9CYAN
MPGAITQAYSRSKQILKTLTEQSGSSIVQLYQPGLVTPWDRTSSLRYYGFITDLRCNIDISSLPESELPDLSAATSRTDRITAVRDLEWRSPRKQLDFLMRDTYSGGWQKIASLSLLNREPYYMINLLAYLSDNVAFMVANDAALGVQVVNVGKGLLEGADKVTVFGAVKEEVTTIPQEASEIVTSQDLSFPVAEQSAIVIPANPARKQLSLVNRSASATVYLSYASLAQIGYGIALYPNGGAYEINQSNLYKGAISAIATGPNALLSGMEAV